MSTTKALLNAYPSLLFANRILAVVTWTDPDIWVLVLAVLAFNAIVVYYTPLVTYTGHLLLVGVVALHTTLYSLVTSAAQIPTVEDAVAELIIVTHRCEMLVAPLTSLALTPKDLKRLLFTTIFLTPLYVVATFFLVSPRTLLLAAGNFALTYHAPFSVVGRRVIWRVRLVRLLCFYLTGLNFDSVSPHRASRLVASAAATVARGNAPVRFTYVLYENQRRWLGVGWTSNLLSYERTPWTDEFLNESVEPAEFQLPTPDYLNWRWIDKTWRLDLTNDGGLQLPRSRSKTTPDPGPEDGWIFSDNTWKKPGTEDAFGKYTRRRRWIRTAELVTLGGSTAVVTEASDTSHNVSSPEIHKVSVVGEITPKKPKKKLRFEDDPQPSILESVKILEEQQAREAQLEQLSEVTHTAPSSDSPNLPDSPNLLETCSTPAVEAAPAPLAEQQSASIPTVIPVVDEGSSSSQRRVSSASVKDLRERTKTR